MPKRISNSTDGRVTAESQTSSPLKNRKMSASKLEALPVISPKQDAKPLGLPKPKTGKPPMQKAATDHFNYKYVKILLKSQAKEGNEENEKIVLLRRSWL